MNTWGWSEGAHSHLRRIQGLRIPRQQSIKETYELLFCRKYPQWIRGKRSNCLDGRGIIENLSIDDLLRICRHCFVLSHCKLTRPIVKRGRNHSFLGEKVPSSLGIFHIYDCRANRGESFLAPAGIHGMPRLSMTHSSGALRYHSEQYRLRSRLGSFALLECRFVFLGNHLGSVGINA